MNGKGEVAFAVAVFSAKREGESAVLCYAIDLVPVSVLIFEGVVVAQSIACSDV